MPASTPDRGPRRVVVIGGGLAGMAAAAALESAGLHATLIESRNTLGGRAGSFADPVTGQQLDSSQHVLLGCCTNLLDFYRRCRSSHQIRFERVIHFRDGAGRRHDLWSLDGLPAPLHMGLSLAMFSALSWRDRLDLTRAMLGLLRLGRAGRAQLADRPFSQWLDEHRQSATLVDRFYQPVLVSALNEDARNVSTCVAVQVFQEAMLVHRRGYLMGLPRCPLAQLYRDLPVRDIRLGTRAQGIRFDGRRAVGVDLSDGQFLPADAVVLATNHHTLSRWVPPELANFDERFANLHRLESVPILGAHLWFDRPVLTDSHAALLEGPLQWVFRKDADGRVLLAVISAAREWVDRPREQCAALFERQIRRLPLARGATLQRSLILIEKRATFSPLPGVDQFRPAQAPPEAGIANLFLAGDYTQTGWPATMEGAVRGGYLAADAVLSHLAPSARHRTFLIDDLPQEWPARLLSAS